MSRDTSTDTAPTGLAVVTGASTGIGFSLAKVFAQHGHDVAVVADEEAIHRVPDRLADTGVEIIPVQADLSSPEGVERAWARIREIGRPVEILALNAGIGVNGRFDQGPLDEHLRVVDLNVRSTVHLAHLALQEMVARNGGRVLITSSIAAVAPGPFHATYAASKAFDHSFAAALHHELRDTEVTVTSLMPGPTDTAFFERADMLDTTIAQGRKDDPDDVAADAYKALMAGRNSVVAGSLRNKVQAELGTHAPDVLAAPIAARETKPQS